MTCFVRAAWCKNSPYDVEANFIPSVIVDILLIIHGTQTLGCLLALLLLIGVQLRLPQFDERPCLPPFKYAELLVKLMPPVRKTSPQDQ